MGVMRGSMILRLVVVFAIWVVLVRCDDTNYLIGVGSYDTTGPAADVNMMGYANAAQNAAGLHFRTRARAFIVADPAPDGKRVVFVNLDSCMGGQAVTLHVINRLWRRYFDLYGPQNVAISGTHTHSTPGGWLQYVLYLVTSLGFVRQSFDAIVDGIELAIVQAHENLRPASMFLNEGELSDANANRSPSAYENNPPDERAKYTDNVDKTMILTKFVDGNGNAMGAFNWFAVHGTSMNNTNKLISGDNKGLASRFMEDWFLQKSQADKAMDLKSEGYLGSRSRLPEAFTPLDEELESMATLFKSTRGEPALWNSSRSSKVRNQDANPELPFVAAFAQSNVGDTTPNILGAFCLDTGLPCDVSSSTCNGKNELCTARGPAYPADHFASTKIIAQRQLEKAVELFESAKEQVAGKVDFRHTFLDFTNINVYLPADRYGNPARNVTTCPAAMGFGFAAGTIDGVGAFDFKQGDNQGNAFWKAVGGALKTPSKSQVDCQQPKPILIDTGEMFAPYAWAPALLPIQILRVGQLIILSVPSEFTTMSGRRLREAVKKVLIENSQGEFTESTQVVIAGLANTYSGYVATFEEYEAQRYEGASTIYGPHTLSAYIQEFSKLALAMAQGTDVDAGQYPPDLVDQQLSFLPGVVADSTPNGVNFGDLMQDVPKNASYVTGDVVQAVFYTGCPRNDLLTQGTFVSVEILGADSNWASAYDDDDWSTRFIWSRKFSLSSESYATINWEIPSSAVPGVYRIRHYGSYKHLAQSIKFFTGASSAFTVSTP